DGASPPQALNTARPSVAAASLIGFPGSIVFCCWVVFIRNSFGAFSFLEDSLLLVIEVATQE
ncbi:MAG TPA: hypothetical protein DCR00_02500, partial [Gammaproteobacteria bacterium]|nr:hypothetical protein [Gammaproteobacteria bacterium]